MCREGSLQKEENPPGGDPVALPGTSIAVAQRDLGICSMCGAPVPRRASLPQLPPVLAAFLI